MLLNSLPFQYTMCTSALKGSFKRFILYPLSCEENYKFQIGFFFKETSYFAFCVTHITDIIDDELVTFLANDQIFLEGAIFGNNSFSWTWGLSHFGKLIRRHDGFMTEAYITERFPQFLKDVRLFRVKKIFVFSNGI